MKMLSLLNHVGVVDFKVENYCPMDYVMIRVSVNSMAKIQQMNRICKVPNDQAYPQCLAKVEVSRSTNYPISSAVTILCVLRAVH